MALAWPIFESSGETPEKGKPGKMTEYIERRRARAEETMAVLTFGVEIETYGLGIRGAARAVAAALGTTDVREDGGYYGRISVGMVDGTDRRWTVLSDGSITGGAGAEVVTPILRGDGDLETLRTVARALRAAGAKSDPSGGCGVHVHVGLGPFPVPVVARVAKIVGKYDGFIRKALGIAPERGRWCAPLPAATILRVGRARTRGALARAWYGERDERRIEDRVGTHYDGSRYHGLNLHSYFYTGRGTAEFRYFDGTLHAGKIASYVHLARALVAKAATTTGASAIPADFDTLGKATALLANLSLAGPKYKTLRHHLLAAWRPEPATTESEAA